MDILRCCVIDDEPLAVRLLVSYVERTPILELVGSYNCASDAMRQILAGEVDVVFLDIEMPQISGIEFAKLIPPSCRVIFTTAYDRYAVQGYRVNAVDYLLKPISYDEFLEAVNRAAASLRRERQVEEDVREREFLLVKSEYRLIQIRISDIRLVEGLKDYVKIYVAGQSKPVLTLMSMKAVEQTLPSRMFLRVHRSYIVNTGCISIIERNHIFVDDHVVPVSESYRQSFAAYIASLNPGD